MDDLKNILRSYLKTNKLNCNLGEISKLKPLGEGGNGLVYSGELHELPIAIKFLVNSGTRKLTRFKAEYLNVSLLDENNYIVRPLLYEQYEIGEKFYPAIIMKKYDGSLKRPDNPNLESLTNLYGFLTNALNFIHSQGIIHRDLKPENILTEKGQPLLADFGIASYNPEIFRLRAETKTGEIIGNRFFSAPEQGEPNTQAHPTMDIYALGQILHWYVTGNTHRGTNRTQISTIIPKSGFYDFIIEKCLANNPEHRFQSIGELIDAADSFVKRTIRQRKIEDPMDFLSPYGTALGASFPKGIYKVTFSDKKKEIDRLISNVAERCNFEHKFWYLGVIGHNSFKFISIDDETWLMGEGGGGIEVKIKSVWVYHDVAYYADTVLLNLEAMFPFGIYEEDTLNKWAERANTGDEYYNNHPANEEAALVDNKFYISRAEYDSGFADVNDEIINLSNHEVSFRIRYLHQISVLIGTVYNSCILDENEETAINFLKKYKGGHGITDEIFLNFVQEIRRRKYEHYY